MLGFDGEAFVDERVALEFVAEDGLVGKGP